MLQIENVMYTHNNALSRKKRRRMLMIIRFMVWLITIFIKDFFE